MAQDFSQQVDVPGAWRSSVAADLNNRPTPSRLDGYPVEVEVSCRMSACFFVMDAANSIQPSVPVWVIVTAQMYLQQYYDRHSLKNSDRIFICIACLFVACKVWDHPRSLDNMVKVCWRQICDSLGGQGVGTSRREIAAEEIEKEKNRIQDEVFLVQLIHAALSAERAVMYALNFNLEKYDVHDKILKLHKNNALGREFCESEDGCDLFKVYYLYTQDEIAWGHVMLAARWMGMIQRMFVDPPHCCHPWWEEQTNPSIRFSHEKIDELVERIAAIFVSAFPDPSSPIPIPTGSGTPPFSAGPIPADYSFDRTASVPCNAEGSLVAPRSAPGSPASPTTPAESPSSAPLPGTGYAPAAFQSTSGAYHATPGAYQPPTHANGGWMPPMQAGYAPAAPAEPYMHAIQEPPPYPSQQAYKAHAPTTGNGLAAPRALYRPYPSTAPGAPSTSVGPTGAPVTSYPHQYQHQLPTPPGLPRPSGGEFIAPSSAGGKTPLYQHQQGPPGLPSSFSHRPLGLSGTPATASAAVPGLNPSRHPSSNNSHPTPRTSSAGAATPLADSAGAFGSAVTVATDASSDAKNLDREYNELLESTAREAQPAAKSQAAQPSSSSGPANQASFPAVYPPADLNPAAPPSSSAPGLRPASQEGVSHILPGVGPQRAPAPPGLPLAASVVPGLKSSSIGSAVRSPSTTTAATTPRSVPSLADDSHSHPSANGKDVADARQATDNVAAQPSTAAPLPAPDTELTAAAPVPTAQPAAAAAAADPMSEALHQGTAGVHEAATAPAVLDVSMQDLSLKGATEDDTTAPPPPAAPPLPADDIEMADVDDTQLGHKGDSPSDPQRDAASRPGNHSTSGASQDMASEQTLR